MQIIYMYGLCLKNYQWITSNGKNCIKRDKKFLKNYDENSNKEYSSQVYFEYSKDFIIFIMIYHFHKREWN